MREVKFRAWDKVREEMAEVTNLDFNPLAISLSTGTGREQGKFELMQYTGLLDEQGTEIYEGDIVCGTFGIPPVFVKSAVEYKNGVFLIKTPKHNPRECSVFGAIHYLNIEVIGNIYENPELLAEK